jgi:hypothetical protein
MQYGHNSGGGNGAGNVRPVQLSGCYDLIFGNYEVRATYSGDGRYLSSQATMTVPVNIVYT